MKLFVKITGFTFILAILIAQITYSQELISSGLCKEQDYIIDSNSCKPGYLLRGEGITINHQDTKKICILCEYRTLEETVLTVVWHYNGTRMPQERPTVWREETRSFVDNISDEMELQRPIGYWIDVLAELIGLAGGALGTVAGPAGTVGGYALGKGGAKSLRSLISKETTPENIPTRWYRGTDNPKELQNPAKWTFGKEGSLGGGGVYITPNPEGASRYALEGWQGTRTGGGFVTPLDVIFDKPLIVDLNKDTGYYLEARTLEALGVPTKKAENMAEKALENKGGFTTELKKRALDQGYDGIIVRKDGEITEAISYKPEKSIVSSITKKSKGGSIVERNPYSNYKPKVI